MGILTDHFDGENIEIMIFTHIFDHKIVILKPNHNEILEYV